MGESERNRIAESVSVIGGADGPASIFIAGEADHCQFSYAGRSCGTVERGVWCGRGVAAVFIIIWNKRSA